MTAETLVRPAHMWVPPGRVGSTGDEAAALAEMMGRPMDPEQRLAADAICSIRPGGRWAAFEACLVEGRQNGKTEGVGLPVVFDDLFFGPPDKMIWTAHRYRAVRDAFVDAHAQIDATPELSRRVKKIIETNTEEEIILHSGATLEFITRSEGAGRALGCKRLVMDEALYLGAEAMGALLPTLSARPNCQVLYLSSAGKPKSEHLRTLRDRGRAGGDPSLVYLEWGIEEGGCQLGVNCLHLVGTPGCQLDDESLWPQANHAMVRGRMTVEHVRNERRSLPPREFARERGGWWDAPGAGEDHPIAAAAWALLAKPRKRKPAGAALAFFAHVAPDSVASAIVVAYLVRGRPHVELADYRPGASWLAERCARLDVKHPGATWAVEAAGAVGAELPALELKGIEPIPFAARDMGQACGHLQQLVKDGAMTQSGDAAFTVSVQGAVRRTIGEGLWVISPSRSWVDVSPLMGAAGALWALEAHAGGEDFAVMI